MSAYVPIRAKGRDPWNAFQERLADVQVPCAGRDEWISETADDRDMAARLCAPCPVRNACAAAADAIEMKIGVWGGRDRTPRKTQAQSLPLFEQGDTA